MSRNVALSELLADYRSEARLSGNPSHNMNVADSQKRLLRRVQETLWEGHDWPHLRVERYISLTAGQRLYNPSTTRNGLPAGSTTLADLDLDRIESIAVRHNEQWCELKYGITDEHMARVDSDADERETPVLRWQYYEGEMIEVWPVPADSFSSATNEGALRLTGIRNLSALTADTDTADLDDRLIVLHAAAETLSAAGAKDAQLKIELAQARLRSLIGNHSKVKSFTFGLGGPSNRRELKGPPRVHYRKVTP